MKHPITVCHAATAFVLSDVGTPGDASTNAAVESSPVTLGL